MTEIILRVFEGVLFKPVEHEGKVHWMLTSTKDTELHRAFLALFNRLNRGNSNHSAPHWPTDGLYNYKQGIMTKRKDDDAVDVTLNETGTG
jgi:hypothetical protein